MSGQIVDASIVAAPKQRNTDDEKRDITGRSHSARVGAEAGQAVPEGPRRPLDGQIHQGQADVDGAPRVDLAVPAFATRTMSASTAGIA